jgi:hypothetical protein
MNREIDQPRDYVLEDYINQISPEMLQSTAVEYLQGASGLKQIILMPEE